MILLETKQLLEALTLKCVPNKRTLQTTTEVYLQSIILGQYRTKLCLALSLSSKRQRKEENTTLHEIHRHFLNYQFTLTHPKHSGKFFNPMAFKL